MRIKNVFADQQSLRRIIMEQKKIVERFLKYISFDTQSDPESTAFPSTMKQKDLGEYLKNELTALGAEKAEMDENGYVYASIPASAGCEGRPAVAFIAHMDTAGEMSGKDVKARIVENYDGGVIVLNEEKGIVSDPSVLPKMKNYIGDSLIVTDGTTLLGADDKAGIAVIMTAAEEWINNDNSEYIAGFLKKEPDPELSKLHHPEIRIIFTPDEEIGRGVDKINMEKVNASFGFTLDGSDVSHLQYENFNAASADISIRGTAVHPGSAFGIMKNAGLLAGEFISMLPPAETPAATKCREGFYHLTDMEATVEKAKLHYILRDHDRSILEKRKQTVLDTVKALNKKYGEGTFTAEIRDSYKNMYEKIIPDHEEMIEIVKSAMKAEGIEPQTIPIRGGTDGARLSYMGLPCPNLGVGIEYCHGANEFASIEKMEMAVKKIEGIAARLA